MIISIRFVQLIFFISFCFSQVNIQFSQTSNISIGEELNRVFPIESTDTTIYRINEHVFDIGLSYNLFYLYTKFEYSESPAFGIERTKSDDMIHSYYLEYLGDKLNLKLGNIYSLYTRGLILNTYQDERIDFDNSIIGIELSYNILDWIRIYTVYGSDTYESRTSSTYQLNDLFFDHSMGFVGSQFSLFDNLTLNLQYMHQELIIDEEVGLNFIEYHSDKTFILSQHIRDNIDLLYDNITKYNINSDKIGSSIQTYLFGVDIYAEYVINKYTRLDPGVVVGKKLNGSLLYTSLGADIFNMGITYEFKRYDNPYYLETISSAPFVYRVATSVLQSRLTHLMNFVNEVGHQFDILYPIGDDFMLNLNLSTARRIHPLGGTINEYEVSYDENYIANNFTIEDIQEAGGMDAALSNINDIWNRTLVNTTSYDYVESPSILSVISMDRDEFLYSYWPYRQFYIGVSGYLFDDKLDFSIGYDLFDHIKNWGFGNETGMTHNDYDYINDNITDIDPLSGEEIIILDPLVYDFSNSIDNYYDSWNIDDYWEDFDIWFTYYIADSSSAHEYAEEQNNFSAEDYYNKDELKYTSTEQLTDSLEHFINAYEDHQKWNYIRESAITIPTKFSWNFGNGNSILLYIEKQWKETDTNLDMVYVSSNNYNNITESNLTKSDETYISLSYKSKNNTFTLFYNNENNEKIINEFNEQGEIVENITEKSKNWNGFQWTISMKQKNKDQSDIFFNSLLSNSKLSIFYGSQRGGLICANGVCAIQPEFIDGIKLSFSRTF